MGLPQTNARLQAVTSPGFSDDYASGATTGTAKWSGDADAYVTEKVNTAYNANQGRLDKSKDTRLIIPADLRPQISFNTGDTVTYSYAGQTITRRIRDFDAHILPGMPETVRLHLDVATEG